MSPTTHAPHALYQHQNVPFLAAPSSPGQCTKFISNQNQYNTGNFVQHPALQPISLLYKATVELWAPVVPGLEHPHGAHAALVPFPIKDEGWLSLSLSLSLHLRFC